jgi:hypothetical protein
MHAHAWKIHNAPAAKKLMSLFKNLHLRAGRHLVRKHDNEESAVEEAVAASVDWNMVRNAHGLARTLQIFMSVLLWCDAFLIVALRFRGGQKNCPIAIADFVLLHNKAAEALAKSDRVGFDFHSVIADTKALLLKYRKPLLGVSVSNCP